MQVPPRPDLSGWTPPASWSPPVAPQRRRGSRRFVALVVALSVAAASFAGAAAFVGDLVRPTGEPSEHRFLGRGIDGAPLRWNPCEPIHYVINAGDGPEGSVDDVHRAVEKVSVATGIEFLYDGPTTEIPTRHRDAYEPDLYPGGWAPVLVAWVSPDETDIPFRSEGHTAAGVARPLATTTPDAIVSGWIAINENDPNPPGFDDPGDQGPIVLHEWGHVMGLDHVDEQGQLMEPSGGWMTDFGPGDLAGLERLGAEGGCIEVDRPTG